MAWFPARDCRVTASKHMLFLPSALGADFHYVCIEEAIRCAFGRFTAGTEIDGFFKPACYPYIAQDIRSRFRTHIITGTSISVYPQQVTVPVEFADETILSYVVDFLQMSHLAQERFTVRDGINVGRYAIKLLSTERKVKWPRRVPPSAKKIHQCLNQAIALILGQEACAYLPQPPDSDS